VLVILFPQPGADIINTIDGVKAELPHPQAAMPADTDMAIALDCSTTIRASLHDTELTLMIAITLATTVVFMFLRDCRRSARGGPRAARRRWWRPWSGSRRGAGRLPRWWESRLAAARHMHFEKPQRAGKGDAEGHRRHPREAIGGRMSGQPHRQPIEIKVDHRRVEQQRCR